MPPTSTDAWVIVAYSDTDDRFDLTLFDALLDTEVAADAALSEAGIGRIDGNEIGANAYEIFFVGVDAEKMWDVLEPVFADAPAPWSSVDLRDGFDDPDPVVIVNRDSAD